MSAVVAHASAAGAAFAAFIRRDFITAMSYRLPFVMDTLSSIVQLVMFFFLGEIVDRGDLGAGRGLGSGYFSFVVIGLVMTRIIDRALISFSSRLRTEQTVGTFEALIATPASLPVVVLGSAAYDLLYGMVAGIAMLGMGVGFGLRFDVTLSSAVGGALCLLASLAFFAAGGVLVAAFIVVYKQGQAVLGMATSVLALLAGAYVPVNVFPTPLRTLALINPLRWSLDVMRSALLDATVLWPSLLALVAAAVLLIPLSLGLLRRAVDRARREGTLAQY